MTDFADKLAAIVSIEMASATPEKAGEVIERLTSSLAFSIAIASRGDAETMNNLLEGASAHMFSEAAHKMQFAKLMSGHGVKRAP